MPGNPPAKAKDAGTGPFEKLSANWSFPTRRRILSPKRLGIGVSGSIQITTICLAMKYEERDGHGHITIAIGIANAHSAFPQRPALETIIGMA
jgi:hypothetical protein